MVMIEITEDKFDDLYDNIESMLGLLFRILAATEILYRKHTSI